MGLLQETKVDLTVVGGDVVQMHSKPVRNEDITQLTFDDLSFKPYFVLTS